MRRYLIKLKDAHDKSGLTTYAVAKKLGLNQNTARKYLTEYVETEMLPIYISRLAEFYGLNWRSPDVVEVIEEEAGGESPKIKTPLAVPA